MKERTIKNGQALQVFVSVPELSLDYELSGKAPVQAFGNIGDREFYFRSRHNDWDFEVSNELGKLPSDVGEKQLFYRTSKYKNASYMSFEEAIEIIENCAEEYLAQSAKRGD